MRKAALAVIVILLVAFVASGVLASVTFTPPPKSDKTMNMAMIKLTPQKSAPRASGMASLIANKDKTTCKLAIEVNGLDPKKTYFAMLVRPSTNREQQSKWDTQGIGARPYEVKVDSKGHGKVISQDMDVKAMMTWKTIQIVEDISKVVPHHGKEAEIPVLVGDATKLR